MKESALMRADSLSSTTLVIVNADLDELVSVSTG
jgi:hypothetical protein